MEQLNNNNKTHIQLLKALVGLCVVLNFSGLFITILGPDGTLYATIAKTMVQRNNYVELFAKGADWLDKPHLPFWITAISFKLFGFTTWAYKLPGVLFLFMGAWYTYLFAKEFYNKEVALWSVVILLTAQHIIISNNDVRAEGYLTGFIIAAVYYFYKTIHLKKNWPLVLGCVFAALAIITKGMFALIPIGGAVTGGLIVDKRWKELFHLRWILAAILILVFILPEIYCLYYQFDLHPEKRVFGKQHVSGVKFFFWDSQFGRFFNTGPIKGSGNVFFFLHTTLWAFLPWSIILYCALFKQVKNLFKRNTGDHEWFSFTGAMLTFLLFSLSRFQLPHYLNIVFPFFAIITAWYLFNLKEGYRKYITVVQNILLLFLSLLPILLYVVYARALDWILIAALTIVLILALLLPVRFISNLKERLIIKTTLVAVVLNLFSNLYFYPSLLKYQSASEAALYANEYYKDLPIVQVNGFYSPLEFYAKQTVYTSDSTLKEAPAIPYLIYIASTDTSSLKFTNLRYKQVQHFKDFRISRLSLKFINSATRPTTLSDFYLFIVNP